MRQLAVWLLLVMPAHPALALDGSQILEQVDANLAPPSYEMYRKLVNIEPDGSRKEFVLYSVKKGRGKMAAVFLAPASDKGRSTLRVGDNMWLYIPEVGKPIRITSLQSVTGGIFNNSDIMRLEFTTEYNVEAAEEKQDAYILHLKAKTGAVAYDHLKMRVDKERLLPTTIDCYAASGLLIKTLHYKDIKDYGNGLVRPSVMETTSPLHRGYRAVMLFAEINRRPIPDEVFSLNYLPRVKELR